MLLSRQERKETIEPAEISFPRWPLAAGRDGTAVTDGGGGGIYCVVDFSFVAVVVTRERNNLNFIQLYCRLGVRK